MGEVAADVVEPVLLHAASLVRGTEAVLSSLGPGVQRVETGW
ncbi:hypothetical protein ACFWVU_25530 [Streptomyces sp. NPDC058686]